MASAESKFYLFLVNPLTNGSINSSTTINIAEIEAYDVNGQKLTLSIGSYSSQDAIHPVSNTIDGNYTNFGSSSMNSSLINGNNWFKYEIVNISSINICSLETIRIYNREDCCQSKIVGSYLRLLENSFVLESFNFTQEKDEYEFEFSLSVCNTGLYMHGCLCQLCNTLFSKWCHNNVMFVYNHIINRSSNSCSKFSVCDCVL